MNPPKLYRVTFYVGYWVFDPGIVRAVEIYAVDLHDAEERAKGLFPKNHVVLIKEI
jgi:hypothetical protein